MSLKKPKCLSLHEKSLVIHELINGARVTYLSKKYGVAKSTICKIKRNEQKIVNFVMDTYAGPSTRKTLKTSELPKMEKQLYGWFLTQRNTNAMVNGEIIKQKAKFLHSQIKEVDKEFTASDGWLHRFKRRFGIRFLKISSQPEIVNPFKTHLNNKMQELGITYDQLCNTDELSVYRKLLLDKTVVLSIENRAPDEEDDLPLAILKHQWDNDNAGPVYESVDMLRNSLVPKTEFKESDVLEWNEVKIECEPELEEKVQESVNKVSLDSAINSLNIAIQWAGENDVNIADLIVLNRLREQAILKRNCKT